MADVEDYSTTAASNTDDFYEGQAPSTLNDAGRTTQADIAAWRKRLSGVTLAGGSADALTATYSPAHTSLVDGRAIILQAVSDNATTTPTLNLDSLGAKTIVKNGNEALVAGDIQAGAFHIFCYDSSNTVWELLNPSFGTLGALAVLDTVSTTEIDDLNVTKAKIAADAIDHSKIDWVLDTEGSWSISIAASQVIPEGLFLYSAPSSSLSITIGARTADAADSGVIFSDGTNVSIRNDGGAGITVYYRRLA